MSDSDLDIRIKSNLPNLAKALEISGELIRKRFPIMKSKKAKMVRVSQDSWNRLVQQNEELIQDQNRKVEILKDYQAQLEKIKAEQEGPHRTIHYVGGPFGGRTERLPGIGYALIGQTNITVERLVWHVVAFDDTNPKERKITMQFVGRDNQQDWQTQKRLIDHPNP